MTGIHSYKLILQLVFIFSKILDSNLTVQPPPRTGEELVSWLFANPDSGTSPAYKGRTPWSGAGLALARNLPHVQGKNPW